MSSCKSVRYGQVDNLQWHLLWTSVLLQHDMPSSGRCSVSICQAKSPYSSLYPIFVLSLSLSLSLILDLIAQLSFLPPPHSFWIVRCSGSINFTRFTTIIASVSFATVSSPSISFITISLPQAPIRYLTYRVTHHSPGSHRMTYAITPRPHIVRVPRHTILLRLFQLLLATSILILASYGVSVLAEDGIILTLVAGRPLPPSFHEEDFSTHSHMGNRTVQDVVPVALPDNTTAVTTGANGTAASAAPTIGAPKKLPSLLPKVWSRDASADAKKLKAIHVPIGLQYWESGREILDPNTIPYNDMNLAKLCPSPAYLGAPASAYPPNAPSVPGQEPDLHDGLRTWDVLNRTGTRTAKSIIKRLLNGAFQPGWTETERAKYQRERIEQGESLRKIFKDDAREFLRTHVLGRSINPWGAPMKKAFVTPAPETMMYGHLQTVSAGCEAFPPLPSFLYSISFGPRLHHTVCFITFSAQC